jgi:hypothetical protein
MEYTEPKQVNKEEIIEAFNRASIPFDRIVKSRLGGFYVYTPYGMADSYYKYTVVERGPDYVKKLKERIDVRCCFIDNVDLLEMSIAEAKIRQR